MLVGVGDMVGVGAGPGGRCGGEWGWARFLGVEGWVEGGRVSLARERVGRFGLGGVVLGMQGWGAWVWRASGGSGGVGADAVWGGVLGGGRTGCGRCGAGPAQPPGAVASRAALGEAWLESCRGCKVEGRSIK